MNNIIHNVNEIINNDKMHKKNKLYSRFSRPYTDFDYYEEPSMINSNIRNYYHHNYKRANSNKKDDPENFGWVGTAIILGIVFFVFIVIFSIIISVLREKVNKKKNDKVDTENNDHIIRENNINPNIMITPPSQEEIKYDDTTNIVPPSLNYPLQNNYLFQEYQYFPNEYYPSSQNIIYIPNVINEPSLSPPQAPPQTPSQPPSPIRGFPPRGYSSFSSPSYFNSPNRKSYSHISILPVDETSIVNSENIIDNQINDDTNINNTNNNNSNNNGSNSNDSSKSNSNNSNNKKKIKNKNNSKGKNKNKNKDTKKR